MKLDIKEATRPYLKKVVPLRGKKTPGRENECENECVGGGGVEVHPPFPPP